MTGSIRTRARLSQWGTLLLLGSLGVVSFLQTRQMIKVNQNESPATLMLQEMQARINGVSLGIVSYTQNHDPESLARIKSEGKEASRLLSQLKSEAGNENKDVYQRVEKAHEDVRQAKLDLLAIDHTVVVQRQGFKESTKALLSLLTDQIDASIRFSQLNASGRRRAVRSAIAEIKNSGLAPNPSVFNKAISVYEDLSRTHRSAAWASEARTLFDQTSDRGHALQQAEERKQSAVDHYQKTRATFDTMVQQTPAMRSTGVHIHSIGQAFTSGIAFAGLAALILLAGVILVIGNNHRMETHLVSPLQEILQAVEAASTGDLSRIPQHWSGDEVGQLSQAVGRLISVLARSENLVYHLAALVESSGEAIISHTLDGTILSWNKGAQRIYGYSAEEVKGRKITLLSPEDGGSEMMRNLLKIQQGERVQPFETVHQARSGRPIRALVRVSAILDSTRKVIGASFCAQDLTDTNLLKPKAIGSREAV